VCKLKFLGIIDELLRSHGLQRSLRDIAELYGCEGSLNGVETHRKASGLESIASKCFEAANLSAVFIDDGIVFDKMREWDWHTRLAPAVGRVLRIEHLAETILNEVRTSILSCIPFRLDIHVRGARKF